MTKQILFILLLPLTTLTQTDSRHLTVGLYNIGLGTLTGGIGSMTHKSENQSHWQAFKKGALHGAAGATVSYAGKHMVRNNFTNYRRDRLWSAKLMHAIGSSMTHNASINQGLFDSYFLTIGMNRLEFQFKDRVKINYKIMPGASMGFLVLWHRHGPPDLKYSLQLLTPVFTSDRKWNNKPAYELHNSIFVVERNNHTNYIHHELIHTFQHIDFLPLNNYTHPIKKMQKSKLQRWANQWIYLDLNSILLNQAFYKAENIGKQRHSDNFLEYEAIYFSNRIF